MSKPMTPERAIEIIKNEKCCIERQVDGCSRNCANCDLVMEDNEVLHAHDKAISAFEKQMPKKPVEKGIMGKLNIPDIAYCPICDNPVISDEADDYKQAYCCYCGQALDWS